MSKHGANYQITDLKLENVC